MLHRKFQSGGGGGHGGHDPDDPDAIRQTRLYKIFYPLMRPLLHSRLTAAAFLLVIGVLTVAAMGLAATRAVPLKMLPFDNKNELLLVLDFDEGTTLERSNVAVQEIESVLGTVPEVTNFTSYVGASSPIDFNGLVRHYYLRQMPHQAEIRINLVGKKQREAQSHALALRLHDPLTADRREAQGADQDRRAATRPPRAVIGRGRGLRTSRPVVSPS